MEKKRRENELRNMFDCISMCSSYHVAMIKYPIKAISGRGRVCLIVCTIMSRTALGQLVNHIRSLGAKRDGCSCSAALLCFYLAWDPGP